MKTYIVKLRVPCDEMEVEAENAEEAEEQALFTVSTYPADWVKTDATESDECN